MGEVVGAENALETEGTEYLEEIYLIATSSETSLFKAEPEPSGTRKVRAGSVFPFRQLLKRSQDRRRRALLRSQKKYIKQESAAKSAEVTVRSIVEYGVKFDEGGFVRNVLFQALPKTPAQASPSAECHPLNTTCNDKSKCGTGGDSNKKLESTQDRTFSNNDAHCAVPKPSSISEFRPYNGAWFNCLKLRAMNEGEPNHLLSTTYDNFIKKDAKALWLTKQSKKSRSLEAPENKGSAVDITKSSELPSSSSSSNSVSFTTIVPRGSTEVDSVSPESTALVTRPATPTTPQSGLQEKVDGTTNVTPELAVLMLSRSPSKSRVPGEVSSQVSQSSPGSDIYIIEEHLVSTPVSSRKVLEKGCKSSTNQSSSSSSSKRSTDTLKAGSSISSNSSELSVKSVISENTDSSSSTSTSVSSSSLNESVSIVCNFNAPSNQTRSASSTTSSSSSSNNNVNSNTSASATNHGNAKSNKKLTPGPKPPKKYSEKMKAEASVLQRISELQKEGMWWEKRLPKCYEPPRNKAHWDYLIEEMTWMATDFVNERKWKRNAAKKCARMIEKYFHDKEQKRLKAEKDEEVRKRRTAATIAKLIRQFWSNVQTVVEFKEQTIIDSMRKKALDQKLSYLVNETEKYSEIVAQNFTAIAKKTGIDDSNNEESKASDESSSPSLKEVKIKDEVPLVTEDDAEFVPPSDSESDVDDTIAEEEAKERTEHADHINELDDLESENNMSYEELIAKYAKYLHNPEAYKEPQPQPEPPQPKVQPQPEGRITRGRALTAGRQLRSRPQLPVKSVESDIETDVDDSSSTEEESQEEDALDADTMKDGLASLLMQSISPDAGQKKTTEEETNKLADLAESFKPKGYTLSSTTVVTQVPRILRHSLREYQHIGLDWLVTMNDKRLNGILADEMGLGKTIQTIALLAYLAEARGNWGPHLIIVPTSVMLNWEMEFKKWCPGFKILTYYGSQKERKLKRSGWTKPNAFHVCITSYKLVIQDHQSFRRKRWKYLILDEAQNIKNFKSQRWQLLLNFNTQRRLLLTGTPLQNNLMELWSLLHFLMPNVFQSHMEFKDWFSNPMSGMVEGSQEYNEDIVRRLHKVLRPFILRRMKSEVEKQLPQKFEHVVMCSLSKRQRFLYEEFMSRTKTKDTLNQGNLLSVINVLMQLRKVCNHPNLFEPRPIVSPFQTEGVMYTVPSCVWDTLRELKEDSFRQCFPLFTISNQKHSYSQYNARRIEELTPLFAYNPDEERRYVVMNYEQCGETAQPPAKRIRRIVNLVKNEPPICPRLQIPLTFFMSSGKPDRILEDQEFVDCLKREAAKKHLAAKQAIKNEDLIRTRNSFDIGKLNTSGVSSAAKGDTIELNESEKESSTSDSDIEVVVIKKRKAAKKKCDITTRLMTMGCTVPDFNLNYIQARKLQDRKQVVDNLNKVNWTRCRVHTCFNHELLEKCGVVGTLPSLRLTSRKTGCGPSMLPSLFNRDYANNGYFQLGFNEIMKMIKVREEKPALVDHPVLMWSLSKHLASLVLTPFNRMLEMMAIIKRYVIYIPAVSAPTLEWRMYRPSSSRQYFNQIRQLDEYRESFSQSTEIVHPVMSRMLTQFPDPRLIQYDCGKLQTLDTLLRRLKTESHRVLIFTQMAKVLDILEAFLNYHGHTYLRLDGATKIDQRQLLMERFNADKKIFCFILSTRSGGIGVNLTGADTVIFYDSDWNPTMDAQAQDRCHRIGQTRDVHIYRLVSEKTVEENILKKSNQKRLLGELAIEGGKFTTTYFKQHTIRELFTINEKDDVAKRLNAWDSDPSSQKSQNNDDDDDSPFNPVDLMRSPEAKRNRMHVIECALAAAEDDTDVQAAQTVHAEAEAEMAEFDESVSLDALDQSKTGPNKFELEFKQVFDQLTDVERYALRLMESTIDDWSKETVAQAQKDLEEQKLLWEIEQQKRETNNSFVQNPKIKEELIDDDELLTYSRIDPLSQVWVAQFGNFEQEMLFPIYEPPTPPRDEMDVYFDATIGYLYDYDIMSEAQLPPIYVPKHPKKQPAPVSPVAKTEKTSEPAKDASPELIDLDSDSSPTKKSPKVGRREDPIFAPKSLFDRPSPALAKLRRDLRLQRYSCRSASTVPKTLGPGSITFPIVPPGTQKAPPPPAPADSPEWLYTEDHCLLQNIRVIMELPLNLLLVNLGQTPNWDYAQETVNTVGFYHRTWKQCKWRYENVVAPREEGKMLFDSSSPSEPGSPSSGKKKKAKAFIKITPPSPSKAARVVKLSQLMSQDNNSQSKNIFCSKFESIKAIANKRAPTTKPVSVNPAMKTNKHSQIITELGINYENPLSATAIAQARYDRIQIERKKLEIARQQQAAAAAASATGASTVGMPGVASAIISSSPVTAAIVPGNANGSPTKSRGTFTPITLSGQIAPLVIQTSNPDMNIPNIFPQRRTQQDIQNQQQAILKQVLASQTHAMASQTQASLTSLLNQPQTSSQQPPPTASQAPQQVPTGSHVTVLTSSAVPATTQPQQTVQQRQAPPPIQMHQTSQPPPQTVVLATNLAQALAASVGSSPISVSSPTVNTSAPLPSSVNTTTATLSPATRPLQPVVTSQPQIRVPTITMQDLVSSTGNAQRFQASSIITTSAPSVQPVPQQPQQAQPTLVSLTPMMGSGNPQLASKIIQSPQGMTTIPQPTGGKINPLQLQYLKPGLIRPTTSVSSPMQQQPQIQQQQVIQQQIQQQQQAQQTKEQQQQMMNAAQQIRRIQVVAASQAPTMVSSATGTSQPPPPVSLPPVSTISNVSTFSSLPVGPSKSSPVVTISSSGTTSKVSLSQPHVTIMQCQNSPNVLPSPHVIQQPGQRQLQLVKQQTIGGKTVTRAVSDAEVAAFLKQHGMAINYPSHSAIPVTKSTPVATYQGPLPVQGPPALLTVGLQNLMKVHQAPSGSVATLVKSPGGQTGQPPATGTLAFPVHVGKVGSKGSSSTAGTGSPKQQPSQTLGVQQVMIQRRQPQDQVQHIPPPNQQQTQPPQQTMSSATSTSVTPAGKIAHITTQVPPQGTMPTHVVVQTAQKQLPNTIAVQQLQQVFKQVGAAGQVISQSGQVLQPQMIGKPLAVTTSGTTSSPALTLPPSAASTSASLVHIPTNIVQAAGSSSIHARIVNLASQPGVKQTIQVVSAPPPNATIIGPGGSLTVRQPNPGGTQSAQSVNHTIQLKLPPHDEGN